MIRIEVIHNVEEKIFI